MIPGAYRRQPLDVSLSRGFLSLYKKKERKGKGNGVQNEENKGRSRWCHGWRGTKGWSLGKVEDGGEGGLGLSLRSSCSLAQSRTAVSFSHPSLTSGGARARATRRPRPQQQPTRLRNSYTAFRTAPGCLLVRLPLTDEATCLTSVHRQVQGGK